MNNESKKYGQFSTASETRSLNQDGYKVTKNVAKRYFKLRGAIGVLGLSLPLILVLFSLMTRNGCGILPSISDYYHTSVGGIFTGLLVAIAIFLWFEGEDLIERRICRTTTALALCIAFAPTPLNENYILTEGSSIDTTIFQDCYIPKFPLDPLVGQIHYGAAALFFALLAYLTIFKFRGAESTDNLKIAKKRNLWYLVLGLGMAIPLLFLFVYKLFFTKCPIFDNIPITFIAELIMLLSFGFAWLIRGDILFHTSNNFFKDESI